MSPKKTEKPAPQPDETRSARLQVLLTPSAKAVLDDLAWRERKSTSEFVRELIEARLARKA